MRLRRRKWYRRGRAVVEFPLGAVSALVDAIGRAGWACVAAPVRLVRTRRPRPKPDRRPKCSAKGSDALDAQPIPHKGGRSASPSADDPLARPEWRPVPGESCRLEARDVLNQIGYRPREAEAAIAHVLKARPDLDSPEQIVQAVLRLRGAKMQSSASR